MAAQKMNGKRTGSRSSAADQPTDFDLFVAVLLDRSGSMETIREATIGAFNAFVDDLRADTGRTLLTLTQFDSSSIEVKPDAAPIGSVGRLTAATYQPRASTPLYDAAGLTLQRTEQRVNDLAWGGRVLFVIITDGLENASLEWTRQRVFARIKELEARGWAFMYVGAHADAYVAGEAMGVAPGSISGWKHGAGGAAEMGSTVAQAAKGFRHNQRIAANLIREEERGWMERGHR